MSHTINGRVTTDTIRNVLVSEDLLKCFVTFDVFDPNPISDHCLIEFSLNLRLHEPTKNVGPMNQKNKLKNCYKGKKGNCSAYTETLKSDHVRSKLNEVCDSFDSASSLQDVDTS